MSDLFLATKTVTLVSTEEKVYVDEDFLGVKMKAQELLLQINWVLTQRKIEYVPNLLQLQAHKSVSVRRRVATGLGLLGTAEIVPLLEQWKISESDRQTWLILEDSVDKIRRRLVGGDLQNDIKILTVSEAIAQIKRLIQEKEYTIEGEIGQCQIAYNMYYFAIKDSLDGKLDCQCHAGIVSRAGFPLNEGLSVRIVGKFKLDKYSRLKFEVNKIQLTGEGELKRNLQLLEEKLSKEGLFEASRKRSISLLPKNILLLASNNSAAVQDFTKVLGQRRTGLHIYHIHIKTQGVGAEYDILDKIEWANTLLDEYKIDTIVLTRGGGSQDELMVFNSEKIVRALYSLSQPTIVAIGHERDSTLSEKVADIRASTPSNAAEMVSLSTEQVLADLDNIGHFCWSYFHRRSKEYWQPTLQLVSVIELQIRQNIQNAKNICQKTDFLVASLVFEMRKEVQIVFQKITQSFGNKIQQIYLDLQKISNYPVQMNFLIQRNRAETKQIYSNLSNLLTNNLKDVGNQLAIISLKINSNDPKQILQKGYAIVLQKNIVVEKISDLKKKTSITLQMQDGEIVLE